MKKVAGAFALFVILAWMVGACSPKSTSAESVVSTGPMTTASASASVPASSASSPTTTPNRAELAATTATTPAAPAAPETTAQPSTQQPATARTTAATRGTTAATRVATTRAANTTAGAAATTAAAVSGECSIKGNIADDGEKIYHVPGQRYYNATKIDYKKGERYFCSEAEAVAAGWRKSKA